MQNLTTSDIRNIKGREATEASTLPTHQHHSLATRNAFSGDTKVHFYNRQAVPWKLICIPNSRSRYCLCFLVAVKFRLSPYDENIGPLRLGALELILTALGLDWFSVSNDSQSYQINPVIFIRVASEYTVWFVTETNLAKGREKMCSICIAPSVAGTGLIFKPCPVGAWKT